MIAGCEANAAPHYRKDARGMERAQLAIPTSQPVPTQYGDTVENPSETVDSRLSAFNLSRSIANGRPVIILDDAACCERRGNIKKLIAPRILNFEHIVRERHLY